MSAGEAISRRAAFSHRMRTVSRAALATVKTRAVTQARVHERQGEALDHDGDVVGVRDDAVGTAAHEREAGDDDDAGVPLVAEGRDAPPPQRLARDDEREHDPAERRDEGPVGDPDLGDGTDEQAGVEPDHDGIVRLAALHAAARERPRRMAFRDDELGQTLEPDEQRRAR